MTTLTLGGDEHLQMLEESARAMGEELDDAARALTDAIHSSGLDDLDDDLYPATLDSCRANLGLIFSMVSERRPPSVAVPPPEALRYGREFVVRGIGFEVLQRAYRIGQATLSKIWFERLRATEDAADLPELFGYANDWLFSYVDAIEYQLTEYCMREREVHLRGAAAARTDLVKGILEGRAVDLMGTSAQLRYELNRRHLAYVIWSKGSEDGAGAGFAGMEETATEIAALLGAGDPLTVPHGSRLLCWVGFRGAGTLAELPEELPSARARGLLVAVGQPGTGIDGFRRSHEEARLAQRVTCLDDVRPGHYRRFGDVALEALLTHDIDEARRFVDAQLGELGQDSDRASRLRATLQVFLEENGSNLHAARRLGVHENTIGYRIRRVEELLGRPVKDCPLDLQAALRLAPLTR